jgi:hypothetical protein
MGRLSESGSALTTKGFMKEFVELFTGLMRAHGCTYVDKKGADGLKIKGKSFVKREPVTEQLWTNHLNGIEPSLGIIPINEENKCIWGCIDVDKYTLNHKEIIRKINNYKLPLTVCRSKSGGAHIFIFTESSVPAKLMRDKLVSISAILGFGNAEVFPKQIELKSQDDTGNFLNLPYFNCKNSTRYAYDNSGNATTIDGFLSNVKRITPEQLQSLKIERPQSEFSDGPPCLESLTQNKLKDGRDRVLYQYIVYAKKKWPEDWQTKLNPFNYNNFDPPLSDDQIEKKKKYFDKKDFGFKCEEEPMCNHCDKKLCRTRKFGIGKQVLFPQLSDLQVVKLDPPIYRLNVDGERIELKSEQLQEQRLFTRACMDQIYKKPPKIKANDFDIMVNELMANKEEVEAPKGASKLEQLSDGLEDFCTDMTAEGATKEDMMFGNVWNSEGHHHFIYQKFYHLYLLKHRWTEKYDLTLMWMLDHCGCEHIRISIGKKKISVIKLKEFEKDNMKVRRKELKAKDPY